MRPLFKPAHGSDWYSPLSASFLVHAAGRAFERSVGTAWLYLTERSKAKAAEEVYRQLARLSDAELARRGLERKRLGQFVRERFY